MAGGWEDRGGDEKGGRMSREQSMAEWLWSLAARGYVAGMGGHIRGNRWWNKKVALKVTTKECKDISYARSSCLHIIPPSVLGCKKKKVTKVLVITAIQPYSQCLFWQYEDRITNGSCAVCDACHSDASFPITPSLAAYMEVCTVQYSTVYVSVRKPFLLQLVPKSLMISMVLMWFTVYVNHFSVVPLWCQFLNDYCILSVSTAHSG